MTKTMTLRYEPVESDVIDVRNILQSHGQFRAGEIAVAEELVLDRLEKKTRSEYFFVFAEADGKVEGFACYGPITVTVSSFDLYWIGVRLGADRSGLGGELLRETLRLSKEAGGTMMFVETSSDPLYIPARRFYQKHGFAHSCTVADFYAPGDDKLIYGMSL